ncbi:MAG: hypothetical protein U9R08_00695 [Nanoarchaeota archaeon]|nr:hypothetical protein [Nanoarchaeota archaeon]
MDLGEKEVKLLVDKFIEFLKQNNVSLEKKKNYAIPVSILSNELSVTEAIVKFLREEYQLSYKKIAVLLYKKEGPIGVTYRNAKKKFHDTLNIKSEHYIPIEVFSSKYTLFESVVRYMHDEMKFSFKKVAELLHRNYRTIWTIYRRAEKK